jgi:CBS domain-containing protein
MDMKYTVGEWMIDLVIFIDPEATVSEALALMRRRYTKSVLVKKTDKNPDFGIVTSTDICDKIVAPSENPSLLSVSQIMTSPLITVFKSTSLKDCASLMKEHHIHHLPVMGDDGLSLIGMISATDFMVAAEDMGRAPGERIT